MRPHIIIQTANRQHGRIEVQGWVDIRGEKSARFNRMLIDEQVDVKSVLNIGDRPFDIQQGAVRVGSFNYQPVGFREIHHALVVCYAGGKLGGELICRQIVSKVGIARLVKPFQQVREGFAVAQGQTDGQIQTRTAIEVADGDKLFGYRGDMAFEKLWRRWDWQQGHH